MGLAGKRARTAGLDRQKAGRLRTEAESQRRATDQRLAARVWAPDKLTRPPRPTPRDWWPGCAIGDMRSAESQPVARRRRRGVRSCQGRGEAVWRAASW